MPLVQCSPLRLGRFTLRERCIPVISIGREEDIAKVDPSRQIAELRADLMGVERAIGALERLAAGGATAIFTFRSRDAAAASAAYSRATDAGAACVDIDAALLGSVSSDLGGARVIVSMHMFEGDGIGNSLDEIGSIPADIYKVAANYNTRMAFYRDLSMCAWFKREVKKPMIFAPMGQEAQDFRLMSALVVSDLMYCSAGAPTAPGQTGCQEFGEYLSSLETAAGLRQWSDDMIE
ncbi:hypothetical protein GCM10007108_01980 [Thermogymnomonas acidicola]|uniref:3-dehydroquinate dehydratase n=1 Tax=Thermogymnomonas acidicola TaxID=399579 RepID=A0AA37BQ40_9ARCH|nr:type I 3-dehydroquinate dehydratase [Thermogymnomonas acidicola]GGM67513.1 hypothetical protein GCM10007108_01980 [Thermogymnomonas acidicola]